MYICTLYSPHLQNPSLEPALVESLRNAWGGGDAIWLAPDEAAEFALADIPANRWDVWADLQKMSVDLIVQPVVGRRKKMLLADMDSTMIEQECIDELADEAGVGERVKDITARAMNGELGFDGALRERVGLLKGLSADVIQTVLDTRITLMPGGATLLATMKADGGHAALVSGGFTAFTQSVSAKLGFDENRANTLIVEDGVLTGDVGMPILGKQAKVDALEQITARLGISKKRSWPWGMVPMTLACCTGPVLVLRCTPSQVSLPSVMCASITAISRRCCTFRGIRATNSPR